MLPWLVNLLWQGVNYGGINGTITEKKPSNVITSKGAPGPNPQGMVITFDDSSVFKGLIYFKDQGATGFDSSKTPIILLLD